MEINAIDQLFRSEQPGASTSRRASEPSDKRFSNLLEAHSARARVDRQTQRPAVETARRNDAPNSKPEHLERAEAADRADRAEKAERAERRERNDRPERAARAFEERHGLRARVADAEKASSEKAAAEKAASENPESAEKPLPSEQAEAPVPAEAAPEDTAHASIAQAADAARIADEAALAVAKADETAAADLLAALALVKPDTPEQIAAPVGAPVDVPVDAETADAADPKAAPAFVAAVPAGNTAPDGSPDASKAAVDVKAAKGAAPTEIALPTSTLAETAKQAEPTTEAYADFLLRNPLTPTALPASDAGKEAAKAESDAREGKLIVTTAQPAATAAPVAPVTAFAVQAVVSNDNASLDANLTAARMPVEAEDAKAPAKPGEQTNLFAQNLDAARAAHAAEGPKPAARTPLVPPHEQVAVHIRKAVSDGLDQISIRLNPAELGRIDIKLDLRADGTLRAAFAADRQQTLEMLKSDSRQLENALSEAGLRADAGGLNFSLRGDNRENSQAFRDMGAQFAERRNAGDDAETAAPPIAAGYVRPRAANGRVDLNA